MCGDLLNTHVIAHVITLVRIKLLPFPEETYTARRDAK